MNAAIRPDAAKIRIGTAMLGGFFVGAIVIEGLSYGLILSPKSGGELPPTAWSKSLKSVAGALSFNDGHANTAAMAAAGSELAKKAVATTIGDYSDWYIPAMDEQEIAYRVLKPTDEKNWQYVRSGINVSALPPTYPYTADLPAQTTLEAFQVGGTEAFEPEGYWTSTQCAVSSDYAWYQDFDDGYQGYGHKGYELRARLFRRFPLV